MKIALYQNKPQHTEIFGTFYELLNYYNLDIFYNNNDKLSFIDYYKKIFNNSSIKYFNCNDIYNLINNYDILILATSQDIIDLKFVKNNIHKIIFVNHLIPHVDSYMKYNIVLTPILQNNKVFNDKICECIYPIYNYYIKHDYENVFLVVGNLVSRNIEDLHKLFNTNHYFKLVIVSRTPTLANRFKKYKNAEVYNYIDTHKLEDILKKTKFILSIPQKNGWYYNERLCGDIMLSVNNNIPIAIPKELNQIYKLAGCIEYNDSIIEIFDALNTINNNDYNILQECLIKRKNEIITENKIIFQNLINKITNSI
jgi:hypothetical protein